MVRLPHTAAEIERGRRLGALLRSNRGDRSILDVALDARVSPETLRKIETGRVATPAFSTIAAVAAVLGLSLDAAWTEVCSPDLRTDVEARTGEGALQRMGDESMPRTMTARSRVRNSPQTSV